MREDTLAAPPDLERDRRTPRRGPTCQSQRRRKSWFTNPNNLEECRIFIVPADVVDNSHRSEAGHWEGDLICKSTRPVLVLHERKSRVTLAARLTGENRRRNHLSDARGVLGRIDPHLRRSITLGNDAAFAQHGLFRTMRDMTTWFCDAYASWQKGGIENANGRLRRWLPRHLDIDRTSDQDIQLANLIPRKCLGLKTPSKPCLPSLGKDVQIRFS